MEPGIGWLNDNINTFCHIAKDNGKWFLERYTVSFIVHRGCFLLLEIPKKNRSFVVTQISNPFVLTLLLQQREKCQHFNQFL